MRVKAAIDSSFLYSLFNYKDARHASALDVAKRTDFIPIVPDVTLGEAAFLFRRLGGSREMARFVKAFTEFNCQIEVITRVDLQRVHTLVNKYIDADLDFVDC